MGIKRTVLVGATVATATLGGAAGVGAASAAATNNTSGDSSLVDKIASKFNLSKNQVQAVFDEDRQARVAEREASQQERLAQAVSDGQLTQAQADHITAVMGEIKDLRGDTDPRDLSNDTRDKIRDKMDELRDWADNNNIDMHDLGVLGNGGHHGGWGMMHGGRDNNS